VRTRNVSECSVLALCLVINSERSAGTAAVLKELYDLLCEIFVLENVPQLSEANCHARLSHSEQLLRNIHPMMLASFCSVTKTYNSGSDHTENPRD